MHCGMLQKKGALEMSFTMLATPVSFLLLLLAARWFIEGIRGQGQWKIPAAAGIVLCLLVAFDVLMEFITRV